jgi:hypothetical protein
MRAYELVFRLVKAMVFAFQWAAAQLQMALELGWHKQRAKPPPTI